MNGYGQPSDAASNAAAIILLGVGVTAWLIPIIVAVARKKNTGPVIVIDLLLGWTVIGWIVALAMACGSKPRFRNEHWPPGTDGPWTNAQWQPPR